MTLATLHPVSLLPPNSCLPPNPCLPQSRVIILQAGR